MVVILLLAVVPQVQAHNRSQSYSTWNVSGSAAELVFTVKAREATRLPPLEGGLLTLEALLTAHLGETVRVTSVDGASCMQRDEPRALAAAEGYLRVRATFDCKTGPPSTLLLDSFFAIAPSHVHYARVLIDGQLPAEYLFTDSRREHAIAQAAGSFDSVFRGFLQYVALGIEHILGGVDHLPHTHNLAEMAFSKGQPTWGAHLAGNRSGIELRTGGLRWGEYRRRARRRPPHRL